MKNKEEIQILIQEIELLEPKITSPRENNCCCCDDAVGSYVD
jgi:hypothetical protein